jgi:hypothetical protein
MSVSAELWKIASATGVQGSNRAPAIVSDPGVNLDPADPVAGLVRQIFFSSTTGSAPRNVVFLAADEVTRVVDLVEKAALTLASLSGMKAAIIGGPLLQAPAKKPPQSVAESTLWRAHSLALNDRVWRLPGWLFRDRVAQEASEPRGPMAEFRTIFKYFLFATCAGSGELPIFGRICDAAVLVVTTNQTRREAALHAKQLLEQYKLPLLGAVMTDRVFEVPEAIYRRL